MGLARQAHFGAALKSGGHPRPLGPPLSRAELKFPNPIGFRILPHSFHRNYWVSGLSVFSAFCFQVSDIYQ